jgi:hypothetical protein
MKKLTYIFIWLVLFLTLLVSCEEFYTPALDEMPKVLVVESHLTNDPKQNYVKLSKTLDFYSTGQEEKIAGAIVDLIQIGGTTLRAIENTPGYYTFPNTPIPGRKYMLRITYLKDVFESDAVVMPPLPSIDSFYTNHKIEKSFRTDTYGGPTQVETPGREICIDAPIYPSLKYYRFNWRAIIQWQYDFPAPPFGPPPPPLYGWISFYDRGIFNIAGPKQFSVSDQVKNHPVLFLGYDSRAYLDSATQVPYGWIIIIDQYGIPKESYDFHEKLNKQFSAEGSLFDPVLTQVYGNIHCKNDASKIAVGFFDLNSYRQYRYFLNFGNNEKSKVIQRRLNRYPDIPDGGYVRGIPPEFWENNYN